MGRVLREPVRVDGEASGREHALASELEQRKELEHALRDALARERAAREEAERTLRFNEMFAGMLGHDLRNPLGTITMGASHLARVSSDDRTVRAAARILSSAERMAHMVDQLLEFTRIRAGSGIRLRPTHVDLAGLCTRICQELEPEHPEAGVQLVTSGDTSGVWDGDRLHKVVTNVVENALSHRTPGAEVTVTAEGADDTVSLTVHNAGGMPASLLGVLFEPVRGEEKLHSSRGLGLGLFISKHIVEAHGGRIEAHSSDEAGTTVRIVLPRDTDPRTDAVQVEA